MQVASLFRKDSQLGKGINFSKITKRLPQKWGSLFCFCISCNKRVLKQLKILSKAANAQELKKPPQMAAFSS